MSSVTSPVQHRPHVSSPFLYQLSAGERELEIVMLDHGYARPWSTHPDASHAKPAKWLFVPRTLRLRTDRAIIESESSVDVVKLVAPNPVAYDVVKARTVMNECERHVNFARAGMQQPITDDNWEEKLNKTGWTSGQNKLFNKIIKILSGDRLARLAYEGTTNEPVMRRIHLDKCAKRFRQTMSAISWDTKTTTWLHTVLVNNLSLTLLTIYLDVLQTLKCKVPSLIDKMIHFSSTMHRGSGTTVEALNLLLKRPWDPAISTLNQHKAKKLPNSPLLLITPSSAQQQSNAQLRRTKFWHSQLSNMGKVVPITMHVSSGGSGVTLSQCLEHMIGAVKSKVLELKSQYPNRPIILIGWNVGALVACQVALTDNVSGVVCLGFPSMGLNGIRGMVEDPLLDTKVPTLFVIGQDSSVSNQDEIEDMREQMNAETSMIVIGGADEYLRMSRTKKKREGITQSMVDRCIQDEMFEFLHTVLTSSPSPKSADKPTAESESSKKKDKKKKVQRDLLGELKGKQSTASTSKGSTATSSLGEGFARLPGTPKYVKLPKQKSPALTQEIFAAQYAQYLATTRKKKEDGKGKASMKRKSKTSDSSSKAKQSKMAETYHESAHKSVPIAVPLAGPKPHSVNISTLGLTQSVTLTTGTSTKKLGHLQSMGPLNTQNTHNTHSSILQGLSYNLQNRSLASPTDAAVLEGILSTPLSPLKPPLTPKKSSGLTPPALPPFTTGASGLLLAAASTSTTAGSILLTKMPSTMTSALKTDSPETTSQLKATKVSSEVALQAFIAAQSQPTGILSPMKSGVTPDIYDARIQAIQKLQFHDFPLTTASLLVNKGSMSFTQAKILSNIQSQQTIGSGNLTGTESLKIQPSNIMIPTSSTLPSSSVSYSVRLPSAAMKKLDANAIIGTAPSAASLLTTSGGLPVKKSEATALRIALTSQPTVHLSLADQLLIPKSILSTDSSTINLDSHTMSLLSKLPSLMDDDDDDDESSDTASEQEDARAQDKLLQEKKMHKVKPQEEKGEETTIQEEKGEKKTIQEEKVEGARTQEEKGEKKTVQEEKGGKKTVPEEKEGKKTMQEEKGEKKTMQEEKEGKKTIHEKKTGESKPEIEEPKPDEEENKEDNNQTNKDIELSSSSSTSSSQDSLPSVSLFTATRTRRVRAPKSFSDYTE